MLRFKVPAKVIITLPNIKLDVTSKEIEEKKHKAILAIEQHINNLGLFMKDNETISVRIHMGRHGFKGKLP